MSKIKKVTSKSKEIGKVYETNDYDMFLFIGGNRRINPRNYAKLVNSMEEEQLVIPIIVNEKFEIVDGQHRFMASKELGLPIYYIINENYTINQVKRANMVSSNWNKQDFLNMHIKDDIKAYKDFGDLLELYGNSISDLLKLFSLVQDRNQNLMSKDFESGNFSASGIDKVIEFLDCLEDFYQFTPYKSRAFVGAFTRLYFQSSYDHERMKDRLKTRHNALKKKSTIDDYLLLLTKEIYSFGAIKNPIFYDVETKRFYEPK